MILRAGDGTGSYRRAAQSLKMRRQISPQAGQALEVLGHAIEYLVDQHAHERSLLKWEQAQLEALSILKALNRQIYLECPIEPSFDERVLCLLRKWI
jgi:hypothetical protein